MQRVLEESEKMSLSEWASRTGVRFQKKTQKTGELPLWAIPAKNQEELESAS